MGLFEKKWKLPELGHIKFITILIARQGLSQRFDVESMNSTVVQSFSFSPIVSWSVIWRFQGMISCFGWSMARP